VVIEPVFCSILSAEMENCVVSLKLQEEKGESHDVKSHTAALTRVVSKAVPSCLFTVNLCTREHHAIRTARGWGPWLI